MAGVTTYSCTRCRPVDTEIIEAYLILTNTSKAVSQQEASRVTAENARVAAENQRTLVFNQDHGTAVADHGIAAVDHATSSADHTAAVADHETASADHTLAVQDHEASVDATSRADSAATAAQHMVDIHQGPPGPAGKAPIVGANGNWFVWDDQTEQYVDSGNHAQGPAGNGIASWIVAESQEDGGINVVTVTFTNGTSETFTYKNGSTGATPNLVMGIVETGAAGSRAEAEITGTPANPILHLKIPQGEPGVAAVRYVQVDTLPSASSHTLDALYLVPTNTADVYDVYYTTRDGQTYSWVQLCTTSVQLSDYATKAEVTQLEAEVHNLSGKYYGVFADETDLPDDADAPGYAFVGAESPFAIWNFDGEEWSDSGSVANGIQGEPGVGFSSIFTPSPYDGTMIIVLSDGNTITVDLNHNHEGYYSKVLGGAQPVGGFLPDVVYSLGTLSGTITFSLAAAVTGNVNHYFWMFDTSSTAPTITWPAGLTWAAGSAPTVAASKHYEVSVLGGVAYYSEV